MNLKRFRERHGLSSVEIVETLSQTWPRFGKATMSMVENPERYGVKLLPQAEAILRREIKKREG